MIQLSDFYGYSMYTISSDTLSVSVMSLGATVTRLVYRGRNVVVSLKTPDDYLQDTSYLGAIVGRYANRIAGGRFPLNGKTVQVEQNEGRNHLHGGSVGFHKRIWAAECLGEQAVRFTCLLYTSIFLAYLAKTACSSTLSTVTDVLYFGCVSTRFSWAMTAGLLDLNLLYCS